jgi:hypothetical protein
VLPNEVSKFPIPLTIFTISIISSAISSKPDP